MGGKSKAPPAPDPTLTAQAQTQSNKETAGYNAALNRYNVSTPFGSQTWSVVGTDPSTGAPMYSQNISLTPDAQRALANTQQTQAGLSGLQNQALGRVAAMLSKNPFDQSQIPKMPINPGTTAQQAIMARLQPNIDLQNQQFDAEMANRGIPLGSDAYNAARRPLMQQQNDQMTQAALYGINEDEDARQQAIQQQGYYANAPLNFLNGLMTGSQVQTPQFQGTPSASANPTDIAGITNQSYQGRLNAYNSQVGQQNSMTSGLFSLGAAALPLLFSDRRLKSNIVRVGTHPLGIGIYDYDIFGERQRGVMADEVERVLPQAVLTHSSGFKMVDYGRL